MRKPLLLGALLFAASALAIASWQPDTRIHFVDFQDATGHHIFPLGKPVARGDALGLQAAITEVAQKEQAKGNDAFLRAMTEGVTYTDSGSLCHITSRSGGRAYFCGNCGEGGCASIRIQ